MCRTGTCDRAKLQSDTQLIDKDTAESQTGSSKHSPVAFHFVAPSRFPSTGGNWNIMETLTEKKTNYSVSVSWWTASGRIQLRRDCFLDREITTHIVRHYNTVVITFTKAFDQEFSNSGSKVKPNIAALVDSLEDRSVYIGSVFKCCRWLHCFIQVYMLRWTLTPNSLHTQKRIWCSNIVALYRCVSAYHTLDTRSQSVFCSSSGLVGQAGTSLNFFFFWGWRGGVDKCFIGWTATTAGCHAPPSNW